MRIAIGQIACESNHFVSTRAETALFRATGYLHRGQELERLVGADNEVGGALEVLAERTDVEVAPLVAARGSLAGPLSAACYHELKGMLTEDLSTAMPVDGVLLSFHGSMCSVDMDDTEGDLLTAVRAIVGSSVPIAVTCDLHANVTRRMVETADLVVGYRHYPHDDAAETGRRAARLLQDAVSGTIAPTTAFVKLPMILTAFHASTAFPGPFADLMRRCEELELSGTLLSCSAFFVGSYIDVPEIGCGVLAVTDGDPGRAAEAARELTATFWASRHRFDVETHSVADAVRRGRAIDGGPVLLLDTADTVGGGAAGDSSDLVRGLMEAGVTEPCLVMVVDPPTARACIAAGVGTTVTLRIGHHVDPQWGLPMEASGTVRAVTDGCFRYTGGIFGGTDSSMGPTAVLQVGSISILVASEPTYDWAREQYASVGIDVRNMKFVGVKNMMNFRVGYRDVMKGYFVLDLPGPTPPDMRQLPFARIPRPLHPFDSFDGQPPLSVVRSNRRSP